jgi:DNA-binding CsgD family transcriptional regulator
MLVRAAQGLADLDQRRSLELLALAGEGAALNHDANTSVAIAELAGSIDVTGDEHDQFLSRLLVGFGQAGGGDTRPAIGALRDALAVVENEHDDVDLMLAAGRAGFYAGDDDAALRFHGRIVARARSIGSVGCLAIGGTRLALAEMVVGRWSNGLATAEETSRLAEDTGQIELEAHALVWRALIASWRGDEARCRDLVDRARAITRTHPMALTDDASRWVLGVLELGLGRASAALTQLEPISHPIVTTLASLDRIEAAHHAGNELRARAWLEELQAFAEASEAQWARARLAHCRALFAGDDDEAEAFLNEALDAHDAAGRPFERARTELAYGERLRRRRRRVDAREHLQAALETFDELSASPWADRARRELRASGQTARRRDPSTLERLTPQELQIARQVAQGLSNREVAAQLFLSPRTIDFHLRKVFSKLGITSRTELAALQLDTAGTTAAVRASA